MVMTSTFVSKVGSVDRFLIRYGWLLLAALSASYYALYFNHGLALAGEGGTTAVYAMRLMEGQRPIADTFLGYNVLWFYPVALVFQFTGPDYLALRAFFFGLCLLTALLAWWTVLRVTRSGLLALGTGFVVALIPGMMFRNYMGLMPVANQLVLISAFLLPTRGTRTRILLMGLSGAVLGLTFLIRIEVGILVSVIWVGLFILYPLMPGGGFRLRLQEALVGGLISLLALLAVHAPFAADAHRRGYAKDFYGQYSSFVGLFRWELEKQTASWRRPPPSAKIPPDLVEAPAGAPPASVVGINDGRRKRPSASEIFTGRKSRDRYYAAAIYVPVLLSLAFVAVATAGFFGSYWWRNAGIWTDSLTSLILVGCSLTLLPQYLFFRPDTPHITEFMVPFIVALVCGVALLIRRAAASGSRPVRILAAVASVSLVIQIWIHFGHAWPKESAGTVAARKGTTAEFVGLNGVRVRVTPERAVALAGLQEAIVRNSRPEDWVVCLPYSPTINFMTDRPSYLWDLYTDNTMAGSDFDKARIAEIEKYDPAVVVIDHRAINSSEASRFPNWAPGLYSHLQETFDRVGEYAGNEVFVRRKNEPTP